MDQLSALAGVKFDVMIDFSGLMLVDVVSCCEYKVAGNEDAATETRTEFCVIELESSDVSVFFLTHSIFWDFPENVTAEDVFVDVLVIFFFLPEELFSELRG